MPSYKVLGAPILTNRLQMQRFHLLARTRENRENVWPKTGAAGAVNNEPELGDASV